MSEENRAAKAARAKALLRKRQREKADGSRAPEAPSSRESIHSPVASAILLSPSSQKADFKEKRDQTNLVHITDALSTTSPAKPEVTESLQNFAVETSSHHVPESGSPEGLLRPSSAGSTEHTLTSGGPGGTPVAVQHLVDQQREGEKDRENSQRTISLLVSEKATLSAEVQRFKKMTANFFAIEKSLQEERSKTTDLEEQLHEVRSDGQRYKEAAHESHVRQKELSGLLRDKDRELHVTKTSLVKLEEEAEQCQRKIVELEEQVQNDDRVEQLGASLRNSQERADEVEFLFTRLKQTHVLLKKEHDETEKLFQDSSKRLTELEAKHSQLCELHAGTVQQLASAAIMKEDEAQEKLDLQNQVDSSRMAIADGQEKLTQATATIALNTRQLLALQNDTKNAVRRAEVAEQVQQELQSEGTSLMHSIDELRSKVVEVTDEKLKLTERNNSVELELRNREETVSQFESRLYNLTVEVDEYKKQVEEANSAYNEERKRTNSMATSQNEGHTEIKYLRRDLADYDSKIKLLEERVVSSSHTKDRLELDLQNDEVLSPHALELSAAHSQIRVLETSVSEANALSHSLRKQVGALEAQLRRIGPHSVSGQPRSFSPIPRPSSRTQSIRRPSFGSHRQQSLGRTVLDQSMSAETRHKRLVGLSMLKARMDNEAGLLSNTRPSSRASSRKGLSPERSVDGSSVNADEQTPRQPHFFEDSNMYWCHSCTGDIIIL